MGLSSRRSPYDELPPEVVEKAKRHILDTFGAALAGATSEEAARAKAALLAAEPGGSAPVWGTDHLATPRNAALLNGIAAHAFELDDTGGCDHSGAVVLPAAVAALSVLDEPVTGRAFLTAIVLGYDVGRRALEGFGGYRPHNEAGWHSTGTCGTFAAAATVASLLRLTPEQATSCLGLAASFSGGLWAFIHDGAMAKRVHAGRAAEGGLVAGLLARARRHGSGPCLRGRVGRLPQDLRSGARPNRMRSCAISAGAGASCVARSSLTPPAAIRTPPSMQSAGFSHRGVAPDDVAAVHARLSSFLAGMVGGRDTNSLPAAQMSLPYAVAARILYGTAGLSAYVAERRADPRLHALIERISINIDESVAGSDRASVTLLTRDGARIEEPTTTARGAPENPFGDRDLLAKFDELAGCTLAPSQARELADLTLALDRCTTQSCLRCGADTRSTAAPRAAA